MRKKQHITSLLLLACISTLLAGCATGGKAFEFPHEVVSDEKDVKPEERDKAKAEKEKEREMAAAEKKKRDAERAALNNAVSDESGVPADEYAKQSGTPTAQSATEGTANTSSVRNDDLPIDPQAEQEQMEAAKQADVKPVGSANKPIKQGPRDYETMKMPGHEKEDGTKGKDYASAKMAPRPNLDSLKKLGELPPSNAVNRKPGAAQDAGAASANSDKAKKAIPDSLFIMMERSPCKGKACSSYRVEIYFKGYVLYTGYNGVQLRGEYSAVLPKKILQSIFNMAKDAKFYNLQDAYLDGDPETAANKQVTLVMMQVKGHKKFVKDGQTDTPSELVFMEKFIDDMLEMIEWKPVASKK